MEGKKIVDSEMDMTLDMDLVKGAGGSVYWFTTISDIPKQFFSNYVKDKRFLDLGCGDGRVVAHALRCGAKVFRGIDNDDTFLKKSSMQRYIKKGNFLDIEFNQYDVLYYFLLSDNKNELKLIKRLKDFQGIIIVYHRKVSHKLKDFHDGIEKQGFIEIENIEYLRVYKKGVKK